MKWRVTQSDSQASTVALPEHLIHNREFLAQVDGAPVLMRWQAHLQALYLREPSSKLERCIYVRSFHCFEDSEPGTFTLVVEVGGFGHPPFIAKISSAMMPHAKPRTAASNQPCVVRSPLTGKVLQLLKTPGQSVQANETILVIEAMKMENKICAPRAGTIYKLSTNTNAMVQVGAELAIIH
jgi:biotin carboxyl carrier protein